MSEPPRVQDITARIDPAKLGLPAEEMAVFDEIAPTRIGLMRLSKIAAISDVRILGSDEGFAVATRGPCFEIEYTTVLEDGFVVSTTSIRPGDTWKGLATLLIAPHVHSGSRVIREKSPKDAFDRHVAFVRRAVEARHTSVRQNQDKALYSEFRIVRNRRIRRLGRVMLTVGAIATLVFFVVVAMTRRKPLLLLGSPIFLLFCWLGGFLHAWTLGRRPLLAPKSRS